MVGRAVALDDLEGDGVPILRLRHAWFGVAPAATVLTADDRVP
jgi:hypothetical protein